MRFASIHLCPILFAAVAALNVGCSDPVPPTPKGAWSVAFVQDSSDCHVAGHNAAIGQVNDTMDPSVYDNGGSEGASVSCSVVPSGSSFTVQAEENIANTMQDDNLSLTVSSIAASATKDAPAKGSLAYSSTQTGGSAYTASGANACDFFFLPNTPEGIDAGKVWFAFSCEVTDQSVTPNSTCKISAGYAVFENCDDGSGS